MLGKPISVAEILLAGEHFDLVVVGATSVGRAEFFGRVATGMIRAANMNVLVVPTTAPIQPTERVVQATDYRSVNDAKSYHLKTDSKKEVFQVLNVAGCLTTRAKLICWLYCRTSHIREELSLFVEITNSANEKLDPYRT